MRHRIFFCIHDLLDNGDLVIRSDLESRGFILGDEDIDLALTGGVGSVRLLDSA